MALRVSAPSAAEASRGSLRTAVPALSRPLEPIGAGRRRRGLADEERRRHVAAPRGPARAGLSARLPTGGAQPRRIPSRDEERPPAGGPRRELPGSGSCSTPAVGPSAARHRRRRARLRPRQRRPHDDGARPQRQHRLTPLGRRTIRTGNAPGAAATTYRTDVVHRGADHPDDLVLDASGALLYSDYTNGTISRLNPGWVRHRAAPRP